MTDQIQESVEAAIHVLTQFGHAMWYQDIAAESIRLGLVNGPQNTVADAMLLAMHRDIRRLDSSDSRIVQIDNGVFGLTEWSLTSAAQVCKSQIVPLPSEESGA